MKACLAESFYRDLFAPLLRPNFVGQIGDVVPEEEARSQPVAAWNRHVVDDSSRGADGVRLADFNGDGLLDVTVGWEEGGITRVYRNPGTELVKQRWPAETVGATPNVEDAVFSDLDGDGQLDVVSCCEGKTQAIIVHWAPKKHRHNLPSKWTSEPIPLDLPLTRWMFAAPAQIDGVRGTDLFVASKNPNGRVARLLAPTKPRQLDQWQYQSIYRAGWVMSLVPIDVDEDGDLDVIVSDRKGELAGVLWLENPQGEGTHDWKEHRIGGDGKEVLFLDVADLDGDQRPEIIATAKPNEIWMFRAKADLKQPWAGTPLQFDSAMLGHAKAVKVGDINGDGVLDLVYSCEGAKPPREGVVWLSGPIEADRKLPVQPVSGPVGIKFDRLELVDLDRDGDLDVLTCEDRHAGPGLGVIWYENPN